MFQSPFLNSVNNVLNNVKNFILKPSKKMLIWLKSKELLFKNIINFILYILIYGFLIDFTLDELFGIGFDIRKIIALGLMMWFIKNEFVRIIREVRS